MSVRGDIREAIEGIGWATCAEVVAELAGLDDPAYSTQNVSAHLSGMLSNGTFQSRMNKEGRVEYALKGTKALDQQPIATVSPFTGPVASYVPVEPASVAESAPATDRKPKAAKRVLEVLETATEPLAGKTIYARCIPCTVGSVKKALSNLRLEGVVTCVGNTTQARWWIAGREFGSHISPSDALSLHGAAGHSVQRPGKPRDLTNSASSTHAQAPNPTPDPVRGSLGLMDRAEAIFNDLDDLLMDACDARLDHAVLKALLLARSQITHSMHALAK